MRSGRNPYYWDDLFMEVIVLISLVVLAIWAAYALVSWVIDLFT